MQRRIGVGRIGFQALADHEGSLAMRYRAGADEVHVGSECNVSRHFLPGELEGIGRGPDVGAAAR